MALARNMMSGGLSGGQCTAINGRVATGLTAAGTTQATALAITADHNIFGTVASSSGARLVAANIADSQSVYNGGANALTVYPPTGAQINGVAVNGGVLISPNTYCNFTCITATRWIANLSA